MSRTNNANNKNVKKPYCKVCHDAGKPESVYTNHWVRTFPDKNGKSNVTCPTLLDTECRYCFKLGHTTKFCPVLELNNKKKEKQERRSQAVVKKDQCAKAACNNVGRKQSAFAVLDLGSDTEEDEVKTELKVSESKVVNQPNEFPSLVSDVTSKPVELTGWAAIAAKPKLVRQVATTYEYIEPVEQPSVSYNILLTETPKITPAPWAKPTDKVPKKPWADYSDSEPEDDWKTFNEDDTW